MRASDDRVVGFCQTGFNPDFALAEYLKSKNPKDRSALETAITKLIIKLRGGGAFSKAAALSRLGFADTFGQLSLFSSNTMDRLNSNTYTLTMTPSDSYTLSNFQRICRSDIAAHLNGSFDSFKLQTPDVAGEDRKHPGGEVEIYLSIQLQSASSSARLPCSLRVHLHSRSYRDTNGDLKTFRYTSRESPAFLAPSFGPKDRVPILINTKSAGMSFSTDNDTELLKEPQGLYGWTAVTITRVSMEEVPDGTNPPVIAPPSDNSQPKPATGTIRVSYAFADDNRLAWHSRRSHDPDLPQAPPPLYFTTNLAFQEVLDAKETLGSGWDAVWDDDNPTWIVSRARPFSVQSLHFLKMRFAAACHERSSH